MQIMGSQGGEAGQPMGPLSESTAALLTLPPPPMPPPPLPPRLPGEGAGIENAEVENTGIENTEVESGEAALRLRIGAPPGALAALCNQLSMELAALGLPPALLADFSAGALQAVLPWPRREALEPLADWIGGLRGALRQQHGYVAIQSAPAELKQELGVWGDMEGEGKIMARIMARLDPKGVMAPGRFLQLP